MRTSTSLLHSYFNWNVIEIASVNSHRMDKMLTLTEMKIMAMPKFWGFKLAKVFTTVSINTFYSNSFSGLWNVVLF